MTGAQKLVATLVGAIFMLSALGSGAQQPSEVSADTRSEASAASASTAPRVPADLPPNPPTVTCDGDKLTISAQNSTLGAVLNAIRACTGAQIDVPEDAKGERLFAELGPGPLRTVLADFLSSMDFNYVIEASPSDPQKVQMVLLNPRVSDSPGEVATVADTSANLTANRRGWLKARENYMQSFTAAQDEPSQQADAASSTPVEAAAPAAGSVPVDDTAPPASSVPLEAESVGPAAAPSPAPSPAADPIPSASTGSDTASGQGKTTEEMIRNMQRMFEQRKQMVQQQTSTVQ